MLNSFVCLAGFAFDPQEACRYRARSVFMFGTIRKHQNWLWIVIITVIIVTFVIFFSPDVRFDAASRPAAGEFGTISGKPISREEYVEAYQEARLSHFMRTGGREWPGNDEAAQRGLERDAVYRVFLKNKIKEMGIHASDEAVGRILRERLGNYPVAEFEKVHLNPQGLTGQDFERFMRREAALQQLVNSAGVSAKLLNPKEAEILFRKENEEVLTEVALFSATNFIDKINVTPGDLGKFFTNRMSFYRIPERIQVAYAEFPVTNFLAEADKQIAGITNFDARVEEYYYQRGTNFFKGTNDTALPTEEAKKKIKEDFRKEFARREAHRKAADFGSELEAQPQAESLATFEKFAAAKGVPLKVSEPFDRMTGLDTNFPPEFRQRAMTLNTNIAVLLNPIVGEEAVYVIALKNRIPSELPSFEKVQEKVTADYKQQQAIEQARTAATNFYTVVTNALLQKKSTFSEVAKQQNTILITPPAFSPSTTTLTNLDERLDLKMLQQFAFDMQVGDVTTIVPTRDGAVYIYLREKKPVEEARVQAELPEFLNRIRLYRHNEAFNQWFRKQAEQAKVMPPQRDMPTTPQSPQMPQPQTRS
jgi:hypothetical protein